MKIEKINSIVYIIASILLFLMMRPYFTWGLNGSYVQIIFVYPLAGLFLLKCKITKQNILYAFLFFIILLLASICQDRNIMGIASMLVLVTVPFTSKQFMVGVYDKYKIIYAVVVGLSMIVWLLVVLGFDIPGRVIAPLNDIKSYNYTAYPFLVIPNYNGVGIESFFQSLRFCGPFDEPGVIGTIAGLMLYIDNFNLKDKKNIIILMSGLLSLSLFFYVLSGTFMIYYMFTKNVKTIHKILAVSAIVLFLIFSRQNAMTNLLIWDRLEYDKNQGVISGDNRASNDLKAYFDSIRDTSQFWWGVDNRNMIAYFSDSAGYRNAIMSNGAVVCVLYVLFFLLLAINDTKSFRYSLIFATLLLMTLYQRPGFFSVNYLFLFTMYIVIHCKDKKIKLTQ